MSTSPVALPVLGSAPQKADEEIHPLKPPVDESTLTHK